MMESGAKDGMWTLDQELARLVKNGKITKLARICGDKEGFASVWPENGRMAVTETTLIKPVSVSGWLMRRNSRRCGYRPSAGGCRCWR